MTFVPENELKDQSGHTLAPMIDFLFLMLAVFASLAVSRVALRDTEISLVQASSEILPNDSSLSQPDLKIINISISSDGNYKWVTEIRDHPMETAAMIGTELLNQYERNLLPEDKSKTHVLLKIDRDAEWEPILQVILAVRDAGFDVHPVYEPDDLS